MRIVATAVLAHGLFGAATAQVNLGTAASFGVIASQAITNVDLTVVNGQLGLFPNTIESITGFPPGISGEISAGDAVADQAIQDARIAYNAAASQTDPAPIQITGADLGGQTLVAGTYTAPSALEITGTVTLDGQGNPSASWVFQIGSTLITATSANVVLINGAQACNIFWQVGSSATLGTSTTFNGNILALTSITLNRDVTSYGGLYALNGAVTLIEDLIFVQSECIVGGASSSSSLAVSSTVEPTTPATSATETDSGEITATSSPGEDVTLTTPGDGTQTTPGDGTQTTPGDGPGPSDSSQVSPSMPMITSTQLSTQSSKTMKSRKTSTIKSTQSRSRSMVTKTSKTTKTWPTKTTSTKVTKKLKTTKTAPTTTSKSKTIKSYVKSSSSYKKHTKPSKTSSSSSSAKHKSSPTPSKKKEWLEILQSLPVLSAPADDVVAYISL